MNSDTLTEGSIWKKMLLFAFPILLGNLFQQFFNTFDSWVVGKYLGDAALAAVSSSASLIFMMVGFFNGVAMGAGVVIARYFGAKNEKALLNVIHTDIAFGIVSGIALTIFGVAFTPVILRWMGTPENVLPQSIVYFRYYSFGALFTVMYNVFIGILHAVGDSRHPLYYLIFSTCVNIILDVLLVGKLHMGVGAAAMATTVSQGISALLCCFKLMTVKESYRMRLKSVCFHRNSLGQILQNGLPAGVQNSVIALANLVVQSNINSFGDAAMAGCGSYSKIEGFVFLPVTCFSMAIATFVSQNLGAEKYDRVKKGAVFGVVCACAMAEIIGFISYFWAPRLIGIFRGSAAVIDFGSRHMRVICRFYFLLAFSHCAAAVLRGASKASVPMFTMLICWCVIRVTYITLLVPHFNRLETISWAYPLTWTLSTLVFLFFLFKTDWMHSSETA